MQVSADLHHTIRAADVLIFAIPSAFLHDTVAPLTQEELKGKTIVSAIKGIVPQQSCLVAEYFQERFAADKNQLLVITKLNSVFKITESIKEAAHLLIKV